MSFDIFVIFDSFHLSNSTKKRSTAIHVLAGMDCQPLQPSVLHFLFVYYLLGKLISLLKHEKPNWFIIKYFLACNLLGLSFAQFPSFSLIISLGCVCELHPCALPVLEWPLGTQNKKQRTERYRNKYFWNQRIVFNFVCLLGTKQIYHNCWYVVGIFKQLSLLKLSYELWPHR